MDLPIPVLAPQGRPRPHTGTRLLGVVPVLGAPAASLQSWGAGGCPPAGLMCETTEEKDSFFWATLMLIPMVLELETDHDSSVFTSDIKHIPGLARVACDRPQGG